MRLLLKQSENPEPFAPSQHLQQLQLAKLCQAVDSRPQHIVLYPCIVLSLWMLLPNLSKSTRHSVVALDVRTTTGIRWAEMELDQATTHMSPQSHMLRVLHKTFMQAALLNAALRQQAGIAASLISVLLPLSCSLYQLLRASKRVSIRLSCPASSRVSYLVT